MITATMNEANTDFDLVKSFISGDESSFNKIALKYQKKIYWHARKMTGNHPDAEEIVQEVLLVMYNKLNIFQFKSSLYTWIYRITATRSINFLKKRGLKKFFSISDNETKDLKSPYDIIADVEIKEKYLKMEKSLQKLPLKQREVFILRNFDDLSYEEIAEITGKSIGGLKANYFHAIKKLIELVKENEK